MLSVLILSYGNLNIKLSGPMLNTLTESVCAILAAKSYDDPPSNLVAPVIVPVKSNMCNLYLEAVVPPLPLTRSIERARHVPICVLPLFSISIVPKLVISGKPSMLSISIKLL